MLTGEMIVGRGYEYIGRMLLSDSSATPISISGDSIESVLQVQGRKAVIVTTKTGSKYVVIEPRIVKTLKEVVKDVERDVKMLGSGDGSG